MRRRYELSVIDLMSSTLFFIIIISIRFEAILGCENKC